MLRLSSLAFVVVALSPLLSGFTACSQFKKVTIPATDTKPPVAIGSYFVDGENHWSLSPVDYVTNDPNADIIAVATAWDAGGARRVHMDRYVEIWCSKPGFGQMTSVTFFPHSATQSGGIGDTVSNGVYAIDTFDVAHYRGYCRSGYTATEIYYQWTVRAEDFHGNKASLADNMIIYLAD